MILCIKRQSVTGVIIPNVPLLPNTPMGSGMQMIDVTGVMVLSQVTFSSVIKHLPLFDTNMVNRHRHTCQCKRSGGCYNELVVAFFSTGGGVKDIKIYTC